MLFTCDICSLIKGEILIIVITKQGKGVLRTSEGIKVTMFAMADLACRIYQIGSDKEQQTDIVNDDIKYSL